LFTRSLRHLLVLSVLPAALAAPSDAALGRPALHFRVFARTGIRLTDVVWTGSRFLYVENTTNAVSAAGPAGTPVRKFASLPKMSEETRCVVSPGGHSFPADRTYCHTPDNKIYRLSRDGKRVSVFATLPDTSQSDGALAFDTVGHFGYRLVAATGRSGHSKPAGGAVYTIGANGHVRFVGKYAGPGGSDEIAIAPRGFGAVAGWALLGPDPGASNGAILAINPRGRMRTLAKLPTGSNPIAVIAPGRKSAAPAGLYLADTNTHTIYFAHAAQLAPYRGTVIIGSELKADFWILRARETLPTPQTCDRSTARHLQSRSCVVRPRLGTRLSMYTSQGDGVEVGKPKPLLSTLVARAFRPDDLNPQATKG
jgi:hypothetical protein